MFANLNGNKPLLPWNIKIFLLGQLGIWIYLAICILLFLTSRKQTTNVHPRPLVIINWLKATQMLVWGHCFRLIKSSLHPPVCRLAWLYDSCLLHCLNGNIQVEWLKHSFTNWILYTPTQEWVEDNCKPCIYQIFMCKIACKTHTTFRYISKRVFIIMQRYPTLHAQQQLQQQFLSVRNHYVTCF